ncbi:hypothetical protein HPB47_024767 [Ixodes persulcatus]|uniref:Uncharacterized protein n=1 Tax=Ixodes persulcatus TaxID=34615 RepID=A0AC60Q3D2_IXOPE|nr:hypothetical protein HPB47_024767 [Ixodes persulcatus]
MHISNLRTIVSKPVILCVAEPSCLGSSTQCRGAVPVADVTSMAPRNQPSGNSSDSSCSSSMARGKRSALLNKDSEEYREHRARNNLAVKKSRTKSKLRAQETQQKVAKLREENENLVAKIKVLNKELSFLKDLFLAHAGANGGSRGSNCGNLDGVDLSFLNDEEVGSSEVKGLVSKNVGS